MKTNNIPVSFRSRFDKCVQLILCSDSWEEITITKVIIGDRVYKGKSLTPVRINILLDYASRYVNVHAAVSRYIHSLKKSDV